MAPGNEETTTQDPGRLPAPRPYYRFSLFAFRTSITNNYLLYWQHYLGLAILLLNYFVFFKHHKAGVLFLGLIQIFGLLGIAYFSTGRAIVFFGITESSGITLFHGNPVFLLILILHFIHSGRYYVGILTRQYWKDLVKEKAKAPNLTWEESDTE